MTTAPTAAWIEDAIAVFRADLMARCPPETGREYGTICAAAWWAAWAVWWGNKVKAESPGADAATFLRGGACMLADTLRDIGAARTRTTTAAAALRDVYDTIEAIETLLAARA